MDTFNEDGWFEVKRQSEIDRNKTAPDASRLPRTTAGCYPALSMLPRQSNSSHQRAWLTASLLGAGVLVNYFDRVNLSVAQAALRQQWGVGDIAFGYLSSAYSWTYALLQLPMGALLDRFGVRSVSLIAAFLWSAASFSAAAAPGIRSFFTSRLLLGIAEAPTFPANAKAIANWFPPERRGLPTAIFDAGGKLGPALGVPILGLLLFHFGWRISFAVTGTLSFAYFLAFALFYRENPDAASIARRPGVTTEVRHPEAILPKDPLPSTSASGSVEVPVQENMSFPPKPSQPHRGGAVEKPAFGLAPDSAATPQPTTFRALLKQRKVWGLTLGFSGYGYSFYLFLTWLPGYLTQTLHMDILHSAAATAIPWGFATVSDLVVGGWLVDHLIARGYPATTVR
jgi:MFS family permease